MTDKYKLPRVQRLVPWRNPARRSNDPSAWGIQERRAWGLRHGFEHLREAAAAGAECIAENLARHILASFAAEEAMVSGALPGEFLPKELRVF